MVIVLDKHKRPLGTCTERRARILLGKRRACVWKKYPFTIIIKDKDVRNITNSNDGTPCELDAYRVKIDPGSKHTGIAVVRIKDNAVVFYAQIEHRGESVVKKLMTRSATRRNRRSRECRYRRPKWGNKPTKKTSKFVADSPRPEGWLPPSVKSIADNIISWVDRLQKLFNITDCAFEAVRFDTQIMDSPDIQGIEYQQGELFSYEIKEYLMDKYRHTCQYCGGASKDSILEWEHILPRSRGGSDSVKNATLACHRCNQEKGSMTPKEWLIELSKKKKPSEYDNAKIEGIQSFLNGTNKGSNRYCAWVSAFRPYVERELFARFGKVECSSGGRTKYNRTKLNLPKDHHYDALCVGSVPESGYKDLTSGYCLYIKATGRGSRYRGNNNACGVIITKYKDNHKRVFGFQSGDIVR